MIDIDREPPPSLPKRRHWKRAAQAFLFAVTVYTLLAYLILPALWTHYEHQKRLAELPMVTRTAQGIPGDPINVGLIGDAKDVLCAMQAAGWYPADPVTLRSSIEIAGSVLLDRPYRDAPVSPLFYLDRRETWRIATPAELTKPLMVLVSLALGSGWPIDLTPNQSIMEIDYVHVYERDPAGGRRRDCG